MLLHENDDLFKEAITRTHRELNIHEALVEKDYWIISVLKGIVQCDQKFVFKGGTSLSKCHRIIKRFSEDIDISYSDENVTRSRRKALIGYIRDSIDGLGLELLNPESIRSGRNFNRFNIPYPTKWQTDSLKPTVIVELANQTQSFPTEQKEVQTFIGEYLSKIGREDLVQEYGLEPFKVNVQTLDRTLVDKVFALCDYYLLGKTDRNSRHIYDIDRIISLIKFDDKLIDLFESVRRLRCCSPVCPSAKEEITLSSIINGFLDEKSFKKDYNKTTYPLLYEKVEYKQCEISLRQISSFLRANDK